MYLRPVHTDLDLPTLYEFVLQNPLGIFTTAIPSPNYSTIQCSHIPWVLDIPSATPSSDTDAPVAVLRGHLARANPQAKVLIEAITKNQSEPSNGILEEEVLVLFNGPVHHYVTPKFYVETKPLNGKTVPTWDYSAVQAYGKAKILFSNSTLETGDFLAKQLDELSQQSEERIMGYIGQNGKKKAWTVSEAPEKYIALLKKAIIGIEIQVTRLEGKFKMSQESPAKDREGTIKGFEDLGTQVGEEMAKTIRWREEVMDGKKKNGI